MDKPSIDQEISNKAEPETGVKKPLLRKRVSESQHAKKMSKFSMRDWSLLPEELLCLISKNLEDEEFCFDVVYARSVCSLWQSIFPFPSCLLRPTYSLPSFADFPFENKVGLCTFEKVPLFLFRVLTPRVATAGAAPTSEFFLGGIRTRQDDHMERLLPSPIQFSLKVKIPGSDPTLINMLDCQILPLGHQYRMISGKPEELAIGYKDIAYLPLKKEGEFVVFIKYAENLLVLTSAEMKWKRFRKLSNAPCKDIVCFRGRFYALFLNGNMFVIDPYSLEATYLQVNTRAYNSCNYLVPCGDEELFLVEKIIPNYGVVNSRRLICRVSKLNEEAGRWVEVNDFGNRVFFITKHFGNVCFSAKELPDGCGVSGNSILFTNGPENATFFYKYGVKTENVEDNLSNLRFSLENRVMILNKASPVMALQVEC